MTNKKGLIVITGPSGVGKGTLVKKLLEKNKNLWLSISATTRLPREGEEEGREYFFLNKNLLLVPLFQSMAYLLKHEQLYQYYY